MTSVCVYVFRADCVFPKMHLVFTQKLKYHWYADTEDRNGMVQEILRKTKLINPMS